MDYIITYNILFFRYDNSNNKENTGEKMKDLNAHSNNLWVLREINKSFQSYIRDRRRKK